MKFSCDTITWVSHCLSRVKACYMQTHTTYIYVIILHLDSYSFDNMRKLAEDHECYTEYVIGRLYGGPDLFIMLQILKLVV